MPIDPRVTEAALERLVANLNQEHEPSRPLEWSEREAARNILTDVARIIAEQEAACIQSESDAEGKE